MKILKHLSFICFSLIAIGELATAIRFLTASRIMDYHLLAMGVAWDQLSMGMQTMTLNFMRAAGLGFLIAALSIGVLLVFPAQKEEPWAKWALLAIALIHSGIMTAVVVSVRSHTAATPPLAPLIGFCALAVIGFITYQTRQPSSTAK